MASYGDSASFLRCLLFLLTSQLFTVPVIAQYASPTVEVSMARILTIFYAQQQAQQQYLATLPPSTAATVAPAATATSTTGPVSKEVKQLLAEDWYSTSTEWGWCPAYTTTICNQCCDSCWAATTTVYCSWLPASTTTVTVWAQPTTVWQHPQPTTVYECQECQQHTTQQVYYNGYCSTLYETGPGLPTTRQGSCGTVLILEAAGARGTVPWRILTASSIGTIIFILFA